MSPTIAIRRPSKRPSHASLQREQVEQPLGRVLVLAVAGVDHADLELAARGTPAAPDEGCRTTTRSTLMDSITPHAWSSSGLALGGGGIRRPRRGRRGRRAGASRAGSKETRVRVRGSRRRRYRPSRPRAPRLEATPGPSSGSRKPWASFEGRRVSFQPAQALRAPEQVARTGTGRKNPRAGGRRGSCGVSGASSTSLRRLAGRR